MRLSRELALVICVAACGADPESSAPDEPDPCETSIVTHANFGEPFLLDWCRSCHSSELTTEHRQGAPPDVDFDDLEIVRSYASEIVDRAGVTMPTMPPAAGPSVEERELLVEWLGCGAP
jgi:uncharacterized membrane protein